MSSAWTPSVLWVLLAFLSGSVPYAVLVGRWVLGRDIRQYGDGNPGAYNVFRAGGRLSGVLAGLLDVSKGFIPMQAALRYAPPPSLPWVAIGAVAGHAFSPWLRFRGGKAIATSLGIWLALLSVLPAFWALAVALLLWLALIRPHAWVVTLGFLSLGGWLFWSHAAPWVLYAWGGDMLILLWKHRHDLQTTRPELRPWLRQRLPFLRG